MTIYSTAGSTILSLALTSMQQITRPFIVLALCLGCTGAVGQSLSPAEVEQRALEALVQDKGVVSINEKALITEQVLHVIDNYYDYVVTGQEERLPLETHLNPWLFLGGPPHYLLHDDPEKVVALYKARRAEAMKLNPEWTKTVYHARNVCVLNEAAAITSGYYTRETSDGSIISVDGTAYFMTKTADGWRIAAMTLISSGLAIQCVNEID